MKNRKSINLAVVVVLVLALVFPQSVFAFTGKPARPSIGLATAKAKNPGLTVTGHGAAKPTAKYTAGELIFKTKGDAREETKILRKYKLAIKRRDSRLGYILASTPTGADVRGLVANLQKEGAVEYAQLNYKYELFGKPGALPNSKGNGSQYSSSANPQSLKPNDPQYSRQWAMSKINAQQGWTLAKANSGIIVAVLDSGIDVNHSDLKNRLVQGTNTVNPLKSTRDDDGHGTHVAGIVGATNNNGIGVTGVAGIPGIKIMPVKVFDENGSGSDISISDGIIWAADHGAKVMNMSFGSYFRSDVLNDAIDYAYNKGIIMVAAAGNWASQEISYPAALSKVIAVSATNKNDKLADFSSYGPQIDVCAPGDEIYSTYWNQYKGSTYTELSGTSMASPMVAGLAALIKAKNPKLTGDEVRQIIEVSASDLGDQGWDPMYGHGRINVQKALSITLTKQEDSNGSTLKAIKLEDGIPRQEKIDSGSDVDWFKIQVPDKGNLQVEVLPAGKVSPGVEVYDGEGTVISAFNTGGAGNRNSQGELGPYSLSGYSTGSPIKVAQAVYGLITDLDEGVYYIKIFGNHFRWSEENYTVTAQIFSEKDLVKDTNEPNDNVDETKPLTVGTKVAGSILDSEDEDWFHINLKGGTAYRVHLEVPDGLDLAVEVENETNYKEPTTLEELKNYDENWFWEEINNASQSEDEDSVIVTPENGNGRYFIRVADIGGAAVNANYYLSIQSFDFKPDKYEGNNTYESAPSIRIGEEVTANFHELDDEDWYTLEAPGTGILNFDLHEPPGVVCSVELYSDPEGEPVGENLNDYYADQFNEYGYNQGPQTFDFKVTKGKYYIRVINFGNISAEDYVFKTQYNSFDFTDAEINDKPSQANPISLNETKTGTLYPANDFDLYAVDIEIPQTLLVSLTPPADLDTVAVVFKEDAGVLDERDQGKTGDTSDDSATEDKSSGEEPLLQQLTQINSGAKGQLDTGVFVVTKPGRYYILVAAVTNQYQGQPATKSLGKYTLNIKPFKVVPDMWESNGTMNKAKVVTSGVTIRPTFMGTEDQDWFKIYTSGKGKLTVDLDVPSDIDGVFEVYDSAGKQLVKVDQSMIGEKEFITLSVPKAGYYYIKAYDYLGNSSVQTYSLTARFTKG